ncbi:MAG: (2Fe-2S)-binding protein [Pseudomonadales bacterium]|nr:(2Fe-2S)-binding protein [Pseudomonadales bacterium]|tara:strand:- start:1033 stop:1503 length:471 start_codon:yes stop_codon:yes gene_type:complete
MSEPRLTLQFSVNGSEQIIEVSPTRRLLDILRSDLNLTGPKEGCSIGRCGACSVLVDGQSTPACLLLACQLQDRSVATIEGLRDDPTFERVSAALVDAGALQCGYCTPGIASTLTAALRNNPTATAQELEQALQGNLCRCTGYTGLRQAVAELART